MKSLLEFITDRENIPKRDKDMPKIDKEINKDIHKEDIHKEDIHKEDIPKRDIINIENKVNENKVNNFKSGVSSIGFRKIKVYRF